MVKTRGDDFRAAVRARPAMYIGDVHDGSGLVHLIWEVLGNSVDQFLAGHCTRIEVAVERDGTVVVTDDGPGMPVHDLGGLPFAQVALTQMHDKATMDGHRPHEHLGMRGVGVAVVNVLSERLQLDTWRDGFHYTQAYVRGQPQAALSKLEQTERHGTRVAFLPDAEIFTDPWLDVGTVAKRMRELAWLNPPLVLRLVDSREHHFHEPRGLHGYFERTRVNRGAIGQLVVEAVCDAVHVQAIAEWTPGKLYGHIDSFANVERTTGDGTHVDGFLGAVRREVRAIFPDPMRRCRSDQVRRIVTNGLRAVVCVRLEDPEYERPTRDRLRTPRAKAAVTSAVRPAFRDFLAKNPALSRHFWREITRQRAR